MAVSGAGCSSTSSSISIYTNSYQNVLQTAGGRGKSVRRERLELFKSCISNIFNAYEEF